MDYEDMSTISIAVVPDDEELIYQGDIFKDLKYNYISSEDDHFTYVDQYEFPYSIVVSQSCDTTAMSKMQIDLSGKANKFMPTILLCPIYPHDKITFKNDILSLMECMNIKNTAQSTEHIADSRDLDVSNRDYHCRFHKLTVKSSVDSEYNILKDCIIDFKHCYTIPVKYLLNNKHNRVAHLDGIYAEQIALKFANYISRVAIP